ncbi:hypothetical protein ACEPAF_909 [Sanghuangporus sanghuang]
MSENGSIEKRLPPELLKEGEAVELEDQNIRHLISLVCTMGHGDGRRIQRTQTTTTMYIALEPSNKEAVYVEVEGSFAEKGIDTIKSVFYRATNIPLPEQKLLLWGSLVENKDARKLNIPSSPEVLAVQRKYPELFTKSTIHVKSLDSWSMADAYRTENKLVSCSGIRSPDGEIGSLSRCLSKPRQLSSYMQEQFLPLCAGIRADVSNGFFEKVDTGGASMAELNCYEQIFYSIEDRWARVMTRQNRSPNLLASLFISMILQPPFLWDSSDFEINYDSSSHTRMFVKQTGWPQFYAYTPQTDITLHFGSGLGPPVLLLNFPSGPRKESRAKMIMQGAVMHRQWQTVSVNNIVPIGLCIHSNFDVDVFLFHALGDSGKVDFVVETFRVSKKKEALVLARFLFNYRDKLSSQKVSLDDRNVEEVENFIQEGASRDH